MNKLNPKVHPWIKSAQSTYLLEWEQQRCDEVVADIFGYHSLQIGMPMLHALRKNRMPHQWMAAGSVQLYIENECAEPVCPTHLYFEPEALPFAQSSLDLIVMPHTMDLCQDPQAALREAVRVLMPEGHLLVFGINPLSLWGLQQTLERKHTASKVLPFWRVREWLDVLAMEIVTVNFGCYAPAVQTLSWQQRWKWMDRLGSKAWSMFGGVYAILAVKKVHGMRLLEPSWHKAKAKKNTAPAAVCQQQSPQKGKV